MSLCFFLYLFSAAVQLGGRRRNVWFFCLCYRSCSRCPVVPQTALKSVFFIISDEKTTCVFRTRLKIDSSLFGQTPNRHKDAVGCRGRHFFLRCIESHRVTDLITPPHICLWRVHPAGSGVDGGTPWVLTAQQWPPKVSIPSKVKLSSSCLRLEVTRSLLIWQPWLIHAELNRARVWFFGRWDDFVARLPRLTANRSVLMSTMERFATQRHRPVSLSFSLSAFRSAACDRKVTDWTDH